MTIYLDIILLENLFMNYIILFTTGIIIKKKINNFKIIISSLLGSLYAIIIYLKLENISSTIIMKVILSIVMVWISFSSDYRNIIKDLLMFYLISFVFGGCAFCLIYFIAPNKVKIQNGVLIGMYPIKVTLFASIIAFIVIQIAFKITKNKINPNDMIYKIKLYNNNKSIIVRTLLDTGNMLKEPISGYPVIIVEFKKMSQILPKKIIEIIKDIKGGENLIQYDNDLTKIRMIPFSSIGNKNGLLIGIKIKKVEIYNNNRWKHIENVIIGIYENKLTKENKYQALMGLDIFEGSKKYEHSEYFKKKLKNNIC